MSNDVATLKKAVAKDSAGRRFKPSAFLNRAQTEAVAIVNHREAYRGISPMLVCEIVENPDEAIAAALEAIEYASKPETLDALKDAKANKGSAKKESAKDRAAALADKLRKKSEEAQAA